MKRRSHHSLWSFVKAVSLYASLVLGLFMVLLAIVPTTFAEPSYTMNYQGKLADSTGATVADGTYQIVFKLYTQSSGGAAIWTETRSGGNEVQVTNGLFSVMLGSVSSLSGVNFNQPLYLGVTVEADSEMTPRKPIGSVPSAFEAKQLGGVASSSFLRSDAADSASGLLTFTGGLISSASTSIARFNFANATGTSLYIGGDRITDFVGSGLTLSGTTLTTSLGTEVTAGEIGNGDHGAFTYTSGSATLDNNVVTPNSILTAGQTDEYCLTYEATGTTLEWKDCSGGGMSIGGAITSGTTGSVLFVDGGNLTQDNAEFFFNNTTNRLGIGTTTPNYKLTVQGDINLSSATGAIYFDDTKYLYASSANDSITFGENAGATFSSSNEYNVAIGFEAGRYASTTNADFNNYFGTYAGHVNTGAENNFFGNYAGQNNTGTQNVFSGTFAGYGNTGDYNNFMGYQAGYSNSGDYNTFIGYEAGENIDGTNSNYNNFIGFQAGLLSSGTSNNFIGVYAGAENLGDYNNYIGSNAGYTNNGDWNVLIGNNSGYDLLSTSTVAIGADALYGPGSAYISLNNVAVGYRAGYVSAAGSGNNILIGYKAADNLTTGNNNIIIGYDIDNVTATADNRLNIGNLIFGTGLDGTGTTLSSGNVGIGTTSPYVKLSVAGDIVGRTISATSTTATSSLPRLNVSTAFRLGSDYLTDITGTGLTVSGSSLTASLGTDITAAEIANGDHGAFTYSSGAATLDNDVVSPDDILSTSQTDEYCLTYESGDTFEWQSCAGGGMAIGGSITSATEGSVLFAGASGALTQDNTNFFFNDTTNRLTVGTATFGTTGFTFAGAATTTLANNNPYAFTFATSTTARPLFRIDTTTGGASVEIGNYGGDVYIGAVGSASDLIFEESSTISGQGTNLITLGVSGDIFNVGTGAKLGIGTTTPNQVLTVQGNINLSASNGAIYFDDTKFLYASTTNDSITFGEGAGLNLTNADIYNNLLGYYSGYFSEGDYNNTLGYFAGSNQIGNYNNIIGHEAGDNSSGNQNIFIGTSAGAENNGSFNTAIGGYALQTNYGGSYNTALGYEAAGSSFSSAGGYNSYLGYQAGYYLRATSTVAIGAEALQGTASYISLNNVALGYRAGYVSESGSGNNILIGYQAADNLTTGNNNIIIGYDIDSPTATVDNILNIGNVIFGTAIDSSGTTVDANATIGIGTSTPWKRFSVAGDMVLTGRLFDSLASAGTNGMVLQTTGSATRWVATSSLGLTPSEATIEAYIFDGDNSGTLSSGTLALDSVSYTGTIDDTYVNDVLTVTGGTLGSNTIASGATWTTAGTLTIGDNGDRVDFNTSGWDITNSVITSATWNGAAIGTVYGGTGADTSGYTNGLIGYNSSAITDIDTESELETALSSLDVVSVSTDDITSANLATILSNETGTGNAVFSASPTFSGAAIFAGATFTTATTTNLVVNGERFTDLTGTGLTISSNALTVSLANDYITPNMVKSASQTDEYCLTYESTATTWEWQTCGGGMSIGGAVTSGTTGSVLFVDGGNLAQDNAEFFFNNTTNRLGIGTTTPNYKLTVQGDINLSSATGAIYFDDTKYIYASSTNDSIVFGNNAGATLVSGGIFNNLIGYEAGRYASTTNVDYNNIIGYSAGYYNIGNNNNLVGSNAGYRNSGAYNNISGYDAGYNNTGAYNNIFGMYAGYSNTGSNNNLIGQSAGNSNTGSYNTFMGERAGYSNVGDFNIAMGYYAGYVNNGDNNQFLGDYSGRYLRSTSTLAIGAESLKGTGTYSAVNNVALGYRAGYVAATGADNNILIGYQAADNLTTGNNNIIIGYDIDNASATADNRLNIGNLLFGTGLDGTGTTLSSGNIGIGTSSPTQKFVVDGYSYLTDGLDIDNENGITWGGGNTGIYGNSATDFISFWSNGSQNVTLISNGNFGVGDTSPASLFTVGSGDLFQINSSGVIASSNNITPNSVKTTGQTDEYCLTYESSGTTWEWQTCGGGMSIGGAVTSGTTGSVLFVDGGNLAQDNAEFFFNNTTNRLGIGTTTPNSKLTVHGDINISNSGSGYKLSGAMLLTGNMTNASYALGESAGGYTGSGADNVALGYAALQDNTDGSQNLAAGYMAGTNNTTGNNNVYLGERAGYGTTVGDENVFIGSYAGYTSVQKSGIVAIGPGALYYGTSAASETYTYNTAIGYGSLRGTVGTLVTGTNNTVLGAKAGYVVGSGSNNLLLGYQTGDSLTTGSNNILIGYDIENVSVSASNRLNIGNLLFGTGLDGTGTTLASGNIGIGTTTPNQKLTIQGNINLSAATGSIFFDDTKYIYASSTNDSLVFGEGAGAAFTTTALNNVVIGYQAMNLATTSDYTVAIGYGALTALRTSGASVENTAVGYQALTANTYGGRNTAVGYQTLDANTTGSYNSAFGDAALGSNTTGTNNSAFGYQALLTNTTGTNNVAIGSGAFDAATSTNNTVAIGSGALGSLITKAGSPGAGSGANTAVGYNALTLTTYGGYNTALGYETLAANTTGYSNVALGYQTLDANTTGSHNIAIGEAALGDGISGSGNIGMGMMSGQKLTGAYNIAIGYQTMTGATSTNNNVAIGGSAMNYYRETTNGGNTAIGHAALNGAFPGNYGYYNTALGYRSLTSMTTGFNNTAAGVDSGYALSTGISNVAFGRSALGQTTTGNYNVAIGTYALDTATSSGYNVAIGYQALTDMIKGSVDGYNTAIGASTLYAVTTGTNNLAIGASAGTNITTGSTNTIIGSSVTAPSATASGQLNIGNAIYGTGVDQAGNTVDTNARIGIGDLSPDYRLDVEEDSASTFAASFFNDGNSTNRWGVRISAGLDDHTASGPSTLMDFRDGDDTSVGSITFSSSVTSYSTVSDERLKTNIVNTAVGLGELMQIQVRDFNWKADADKSTLTHGFIAQELAQIYPQAVTIPRNQNDIWQVDYSKLMPLVIAGVQDQQVQVVEQGATLGSLGEQLLTTIKSISDLEAAVSSGLSENYRTTDDTIEAGELVALDRDNDATIKRAEPGDEIFGVVSENAGIILGDGMSSAKPVALTGRVKVRVNDEGGDIKRGDAITLSSEAGIGTKATTTTRVIGTALEETNNDTDTIHIYVSPRTHFAFNETAAIASLFTPIENNDNDTLWGRITTLASNFVDGMLTVAGIKTEELCVGDVCVDEETFLEIVEQAGQTPQSSGNGSAGSPEPEPVPTTEPVDQPQPEPTPEPEVVEEPQPEPVQAQEPTPEPTT